MVKRAEKESEAQPARLPTLDHLATALHASFLERWGRHDRAGLEREIDERRAESTRRSSIA